MEGEAAAAACNSTGVICMVSVASRGGTTGEDVGGAGVGEGV